MQSHGARLFVWAFALLLLVGLVVWMNSGYAQLDSQSYDYALALVSACSRQDEARVQRIANEIAERKLPNYDRRVILEITAKALAGKWEAAADSAFDLLKAQSQPAN